MTIALTITTDGRGELLEQAAQSLTEHLRSDGHALTIHLHDDSGDPEYSRWLEGRFPDFSLMTGERRKGLAGAVRAVWTKALEDPAVEFVLHLEDDFLLTDDLDLGQLAEILRSRDDLASVTLKRQPVSPGEIDAGGQIELAEKEGETFEEWHVISYEDDVDTDLGWATLHHRLFSFNPSLIRRAAIEKALTAPVTLEREVTDVLLASGYTFAYLGRKDDAPRCRHIGEHRSPGYRL